MSDPSAVPAARRAWPLVIVANTLPVRRVVEGDATTWSVSPGGLVSAMTPIIRSSEAAWIGWTGEPGDVPEPFLHGGIYNIPIPVSPEEQDGSYEGMCNRTLWPLYHDAVRHPEYHRRWWRHYVAVNRRFAEAAAVAADRGALVWVHDYQLQLVPAMLRTLRPDVRIGFFLHIPFPPEELFLRLPWRRQVLEGMLGADVIGFQMASGAHNFGRLAHRLTEAAGRGRRLKLHDRMIHVDAFPISVDFELFDRVARDPAVERRAQELKRTLGRGRQVLLGVDRLDYTKGIDLRLKAFRQLLTDSRHSIRDAVLVQVAVPSRQHIAEYQSLRREVEELVGQINGQFGEVGVAPVHYLRRTLPFDELVAMYRMADVMLVTPLADGMNLVAKEYVATRHDDTGALVLSEFTGAASELRSAFTVNPHDVDGMTEAVERALEVTPREAARRMRAMRRVVRQHDVREWSESFLRVLQQGN